MPETTFNTLFIGKNTIELERIESTNSYAKNLLNEGRPVEGTLVWAHEQTAGRGQMGNTWQSEGQKNLTVSFILYPDFLSADKQFFLNMAVSLAVKDCCEDFLTEEIRIKWPNDIYCGDKKLGGILIENSLSGSTLQSTVIGIGLNVNQTAFAADVPNPTSLQVATGKPFSVQQVLERLCVYLEKYYLQLRQLHFNFLDRAYTDALYRYQQTHEFKKGEQVFKGEINGVGKDGRLIIHSQGKEQRFAFKEVEYIL
ncbi:MAG: biotin--[acetyl-CoA-carboxylase] ligase [Chitinophagales bacterium]